MDGAARSQVRATRLTPRTAEVSARRFAQRLSTPGQSLEIMKLHNVPVVRCAIYTRIATINHSENELRAQRANCEKLVVANHCHGWQTRFVFHDEGYSGSHLQRPGMEALLRAVRAGDVDRVVAPDFACIGRSAADLVEFLNTLGAHGVLFVSAVYSLQFGAPIVGALVPALVCLHQVEIEQGKRAASEN